MHDISPHIRAKPVIEGPMLSFDPVVFLLLDGVDRSDRLRYICTGLTGLAWKITSCGGPRTIDTLKANTVGMASNSIGKVMSHGGITSSVELSMTNYYIVYTP